ncbi:MAG: hypothetical protein MRZ79_07935 [Bacteroidia bacterium]|nr:hypothetical protein [Bacteroidia bacterium]
MLTLQGCDNSGCTDPDSLNFDPEATEDNGKCDFPNLTVNFSYSVDGQELTKGTTYTINGTAISFSDVQFYVFNPRVAKDGVMEATGETHFISFDNRSIEFEDLTAGHKHMLMFGLGVDSTTNATIQPSDSDLADGAALGPQNPSMHWGWDNGYIFLKMDGMVDTDGDNVPNAGMEFHIGKNINFNTIALEIHTDALEDEVEVTVDVDFAKAFTGIDLSKDYITHTGDFPALANTVINNMKTAFAKK